MILIKYLATKQSICRLTNKFTYSETHHTTYEQKNKQSNTIAQILTRYITLDSVVFYQ